MSGKRAKRKTPSTSSSANPAKRTHGSDIVRAIERANKAHDSYKTAIEKNVQAYQSCIDQVELLFNDTLRNADEDLEDRQKILDELNDKIAYEERQGQIKIKQDLDEFAMTEVKKILDAHDLVSIPRTERETLRQNLANEQASHEAEVLAAVEKTQKQEKLIHKTIVSRVEAECALKLAKTEAELASKDTIITNLRDSMRKSEDALEAQRSLTKDVADAASRNSATIYTGNSSK